MTESELIEELYQALNGTGPDDAFTTAELGEHLGLAEAATRKRIRAAAKLGRIVPVKIKRENVWGQMQSVKGYRLLPE